MRLTITKVYLEELNRHCWKNGFICPNSSLDKSYRLKSRHLHESQVRSSSFVDGRDGFQHTRLLLPKWFEAICPKGADMGGISAEQLYKMVGVAWPTAYRILRKLRQSMGDREYWLNGLVELDDAFVEGRSAAGKKPVIFAVAQRKNGMDFKVARLAEWVNSKRVREFARRISPDSEDRKDAFLAQLVMSEKHLHEAKVTTPVKKDEWLLKVHIVISDFKSFLSGTFHVMSHRHLQKFIEEFVFRFNRRIWEPQLPDRLILATVDHVPIRGFFTFT